MNDLSTNEFDEDYDPRFKHDMLMCMIALHEAKTGNVVNLGNCSKVAVALIKEDEELPLHLLGKKRLSNA